MPEAIAVSRFNHAALNATEIARSVAFYKSVLGFYEVPRPSLSFAGSWLYSDGLGMMLHLIDDESFEPSEVPINTRTNHLAFRVADFDRARQLLEAHGLEFVERKLPDHGYRQIFFRDPDGNVLELGEWPDVEQMQIEPI